jgi:hypothetical protein
MNYMLDFLFGFLGFFVGLLVWELGKDWAKREWEALTTRKSFAEVQQELLKDVKRPLPPDFDDEYEKACELVRQATRPKPNPKLSNKHTVAEILAMARAEKTPPQPKSGLSMAEILAAARKQERRQGK